MCKTSHSFGIYMCVHVTVYDGKPNPNTTTFVHTHTCVESTKLNTQNKPSTTTTARLNCNTYKETRAAAQTTIIIQRQTFLPEAPVQTPPPSSPHSTNTRKNTRRERERERGGHFFPFPETGSKPKMFHLETTIHQELPT